MFVKDPCGIICILITYCGILYANYVVLRWIIMQSMGDSIWGPINAVVFNYLVICLIVAHLKASLTDPGIVPLPTNRLDFSDVYSELENETTDWTICTRCETYRPPRAHHCRICKRCIRKMDHHCPWINNCVGETNQKYFIQFLMYVGLMAVYSIILIIFAMVFGCGDCEEDVPTKQKRMMHQIILLLESTLFGLFVIAILCDQISSITSDETGMEHMKKKGPFRPRKAKMTLMSEVCGRRHPFLWLFPCISTPKTYGSPFVNYHV